MRKSLSRLAERIEFVDASNIYSAISELKQILFAVIEELDHALPIDKEDDQ